jgi:G:T/U-mismatch repair DNA glycosylase
MSGLTPLEQHKRATISLLKLLAMSEPELNALIEQHKQTTARLTLQEQLQQHKQMTARLTIEEQMQRIRTQKTPLKIYISQAGNRTRTPVLKKHCILT